MTTRSTYMPALPLRLAALALALALGGAAAATAATGSIRLHDSAVADDTRVYTMRPGGGIDAIEIASGSELWRSNAADRPVTRTDDTLLAQRDDSARSGTLSLVLLDIGSGATVANGSLGLPAGVRASVDDRLDSRFELHAAPEQADELVWRYTTRPAQGALTDDAVARQRRADGIVEVSASRTALRLSASSRAAPASGVINRVADVTFAGADGRAFYSEDRRHVLVSRRVNRRDYAWSVHTPDGALLGKTRAAQSYVPFVVRANTLLFVSPPGQRRVGQAMQLQPLTLRAVDLRSGQQAWSVPLRDTRYAGPYPP